METKLNYDRDQALIQRFNAPLSAERAGHQLEGMATMIALDGQIDDNELKALADWLAMNEQHRGLWPICDVYNLVQDILADGIVTQEERRLLFRVLREYTVTKETNGKAVETIFDDDAEVVIGGRAFVVTGVLQYSKRKPFLDMVTRLGGVAHSSVRRDTDYLIVGDDGSGAWRHSRYGRKIEEAQAMKRDGHRIRIIREVLALDALLAIE